MSETNSSFVLLFDLCDGFVTRFNESRCGLVDASIPQAVCRTRDLFMYGPQGLVMDGKVNLIGVHSQISYLDQLMPCIKM